MNYELINNDEMTAGAWKKVKQRLKHDDAQVIMLSAFPGFSGWLAREGIHGINVVDWVTRRQYQPDTYRFFNDVPVPTGSKVQMNDNGSISIIDDGVQIAREFLFPHTRRAVQDIRYSNPDGSLDYIEEYAADGNVFSNIFYAEGDIQEIVFYNNAKQAVLRYYFYDNDINCITIENPQTHAIIAHYETLIGFLRAQVAKIVQTSDNVTISYLGVELDALQKTQSHNVLQMAESPFTEDHQVRGFLAAILKGENSTVQEVRVPQPDFHALIAAGMPRTKLILSD